MKILRRNDEFRKMPERDITDVLAIKNLINQGWNYCAKSIYKEQVGIQTSAQKAKIKEDKTAQKALEKLEKAREKKSDKKADKKSDKKKSDRKKSKK